MKAVICDTDTLAKFGSLVAGPFNPSDLPEIERLIRAVVLSDDVLMVPEKLQQESTTGDETVVKPVTVPFEGFGIVNKFDQLVSVKNHPSRESPVNLLAFYLGGHQPNDLKLLKFFYGKGNDYSFVFSYEGVGQQLVEAERFPEGLFAELDERWKEFARHCMADGFGLLAPPILGIVLTRAATREAIPGIVADLRAEWSAARRKVWQLLGEMREARTIGHAQEIRLHLEEASRLFSPQPTEFDTRPVRVIWEILSSAGAGFLAAKLTGSNLAISAITGAATGAARSAPSLMQEFGLALFSRGAFDLARRVRREITKNERDALIRLRLLSY